MAFGETVGVRPGTKLNPRTGDQETLPGTPHTLTGCIVGPVDMTETIGVERDAELNLVSVHVTGPVAVPLKRTDVLTIRGDDYEITKLPPAWIDPEGEADMGGLVITATRAEG